MEKNIELLNQKFKEIKRMGWILGDKHNTGSVGLLFESCLGKERENFEIPDFHGIEIKVKGRSKENNITLFNSAPDSYLMEVYRLKEEYGYPDQDFQEFKVFNVQINAKHKTKIPSGYKMQLYVNEALQIVELIVYDKNNCLIDDKTSWTFALLEEKLTRKLSYLAYIEAESQYWQGNKYYRYNQITFYKLKGMNTFLKLLKQGKICISFQVGIRKSGNRIGQKYDHGTAFVISKYHLSYLFDKINIPA